MSDRPELAEFLRARREGLRPADVGLPDSGRRRTPGLRREEVATLAGVSIDYLVRLEQGRDLHPSPSVLVGLAKALRLTDDETMHLAKLAAVIHKELCPTNTGPLIAPVAPGVRQLLDSLAGIPAFVLGPATHLLAWNEAWQQLGGPLGLLDGPSPNLALYTFTNPVARAVFHDWGTVADDQVSRLRAAELRWGTDEAFGSLVAELENLPDFASRWSSHAVAERHRGVQRIQHPLAGELRLAYEVLVLPADGEQRLTTWLPADNAAAASFHAALNGTRPAGRPQLRVVSNQ
jgi:transcriptional regulator with XRE-family HTH domain